jgi:hypothetical protein
VSVAALLTGGSGIYREIVDQLVSAAETTVGIATPYTGDRHPSHHWIQKEPQ